MGQGIVEFLDGKSDITGWVKVEVGEVGGQEEVKTGGQSEMSVYSEHVSVHNSVNKRKQKYKLSEE